MFKINIDRYKNYINNFSPVRNVLPNLKHQKITKIFYKKILVNSMYLKRHKIYMYKPVKKFKYSFLFLHNIKPIKKFFEKNDRKFFFS